MVDQGACLAVGRGRDQVPDEALDVLVPLVMGEAVHEDGPADSLHILLSELAFVASMGKYVRPPPPAAKQACNMPSVSAGAYVHSQAAGLGHLGSKL